MDKTSELFKAGVVATIQNSAPERALELLSGHFNVETPKIRVGVTKGRSRGVRAVYLRSKREILVAKAEYLCDPFTILHEFYHHLRYVGDEHRGTEKYADKFAREFIEAYHRTASQTRLRPEEFKG